MKVVRLADTDMQKLAVRHSDIRCSQNEIISERVQRGPGTYPGKVSGWESAQHESCSDQWHGIPGEDGISF